MRVRTHTLGIRRIGLTIFAPHSWREAFSLHMPGGGGGGGGNGGDGRTANDAMCFQLDYRGVSRTGGLAEGSYIGCTKCSGSLGFRDGTTNAEANTTANNCYGHFGG